MTEAKKERKRLITIATIAAVLIALLYLWLKRSNVTGYFPQDAFKPATFTPTPPIQLEPVNIQVESDCCCCNHECAVSPVIIPSLNQIALITNAYNNAITHAGNMTLLALADVANENDPFLQVTVG